jgi:lipoprotein-releasing system permease protein
MPFELHIALRYLLARRRQAFISVISLISTLGVMVGVTALIIALALMTGLQGELRSRILGAAAHVYVTKQGGLGDYRAEVARLKRVPGVVGAAPTILGKALVRNERGDQFITLKGIDATLEPGVTDIGKSMVKGGVAALEAPTSGDDPPGILIGTDLARELELHVGDSVTILTPEGTLSPMGIMPRTRRLRIAGVFHLGLYEFDATYGFVSLSLASRLLDKNPDLIELRVQNFYDAPVIARGLAATLGPEYWVQDWADMNKSLYSALWLEKMAISITIGLIVMVAALNIIASLVLLVMEKSRDIAILKTMGASSRAIMTIFMLQGLIIGLVGTAAGAGLGTGLAWVLNEYRLIRIPADVYQVSYVPFVILPGDFAVVIGAAVLICFLATLYPSRQAARLEPVAALRFE